MSHAREDRGDTLAIGCPWCLGRVSLVDDSIIQKDGQTWHAKCHDLHTTHQRIARGKTMPLKCQMLGCTSPAREDSGFCFDHRGYHYLTQGKTMPNPSTATEQPPQGIDAILSERGSRYGRFDQHANITQQIKRIMVAHAVERGDPQIPKRTWDILADDQKEALDMIAHKIGRILNGDPDYIDSWDDIAGYAKLVADRLRGNAK